MTDTHHGTGRFREAWHAWVRPDGTTSSLRDDEELTRCGRWVTSERVVADEDEASCRRCRAGEV